LLTICGKSIAGIQARLRQYSAEIPPSQWIRAAKYNETQLIDKRHPTRKDLDEAVPDNPTILVHDSGKLCVLNSMALTLLGITKNAPDHSGGYIGRDEKPGILMESSMAETKQWRKEFLHWTRRNCNKASVWPTGSIFHME